MIHDEKQEDKNRMRHIIIYAIMIILILITLLTSCSCTSMFFGKIGDEFFNQGDYTIEKEILDLETRRNKELKFDRNYVELSVGEKAKVGFSYKKIKPQKFSCTTSDASVATCYVVGKYVVINTHKKGTVTVVLQTTTNHMHYEATLLAKVGKTKVAPSIKLSSQKGTINLAETNEKLVTYQFIGLSGRPKVSSSDEHIAKVELKDGYFKITAFKTGKVTITLTLRYRGKTYKAKYLLTVINESTLKKHKDANCNLKDIKLSTGTLSPKFSPYRTSYYVQVGSSVDKIDIRAIAESGNAVITYNGKKLSSLKDFPLQYGDNTVVITVRAEDGSTKSYTITIHREKKEDAKKDTNAYLKDIQVSVGKLSPDFSKEKTEYKVVVDANTDKIDIKAIAESSKAEITYNGKKVSSLKDLDLKYGDNKVVITVRAEDGTLKDYIVNIYRESKYTLKFDRNLYQFSMYTENLDFAILYKVYKNGIETTDYDHSKISASISEKFSSVISVENPEKGVLVLKPDETLKDKFLNQSIKLSLNYQDASTTTTVIFDDVKAYLNSSKDKYQMSVSKDETGNIRGNIDVILNTNIFTGKVSVSESDDKKEIKICSLKQQDTCIIVSTNDQNIEYLAYDSSEEAPNYLPIGVYGNNPGGATLTIRGVLNGKEFENLSIPIEIIRKYSVFLSANGGQFNAAEDHYQFEISADEKIDLSDYDEPYKLDEKDHCKYYKFLGYSKTIDGPILYNRSDKKIIENLDDDLELFAIYDSVSIPITDDLLEEVLWLKDVPIFHNEEYYNQYHEDKVIYPGAKGYYIANFKNEYADSITLTGMTLLEDTICIPKKGCLNMGYIVRHIPALGKEAYYYYGNLDQYQVLNYDVDPTLPNYKGKKINFNQPITLKKGEEAPITIFWKWVEMDSESDKLDTLIGNQAAQAKFDETLNDRYFLSVALHFKTNKICK